MAFSQMACLFAVVAFGLCNGLPAWQRRIVKRDAPVLQFEVDDVPKFEDFVVEEGIQSIREEMHGEIGDYHHDCDKVITNYTAPLFKRSTCPWMWVKDEDVNRYPSTILKAVRKCDNPAHTCIGDDSKLMQCVPISQEIKVLKRVGGTSVFETQVEKVNIGFTCAGAIEAPPTTTEPTTSKPVTTTKDPFNK